MSKQKYDVADAAFQEHIVEHWRDWVAYLTAHLTLIAVRAAQRDVSAIFEQDEDEARAKDANKKLRRLPSARTARFTAERELMRQQVQVEQEAEARAIGGRIGPLDPDLVERTALERLLAQAQGLEGVVERPGRGLVPVDQTWYTVDAAALLAAPSEAAYALRSAEADDTRRRILLMVGIVVCGLLLTILPYLWPKGHVAPVVRAAQPLQVNGSPLTDPPWAVRSITIAHVAAPSVTIPVSVTTTRWPETDAETLAAYQHGGELWPLRLCLAGGTDLATASSLTLAGRGDVPDRDYILTTQPAGADLIVEACGAAAAEPRYAVFETVTPLADLALGQRGLLDPTTSLTLTTITVIGRGADLTLPADRAAVMLQLATTGRVLDWPSLAPTLLLADGQAVLPQVTSDQTGATLRYLVTLPSTPTEGVLRLLPAGQPALRWRFPLSPPETRLEVLRRSLRLSAPQVTRDTQDGADALLLRLTLTNTSRAPLVLAADDISIVPEGQSQRLALPALPTLADPLAPGETRSVVIRLDRRSGLVAAIVTFGPQRLRVAWPEGR